MEKAHEEMREYLETHKIEDVFVMLTEKVLTVQPTNPIGYLVGELLTKYPEETKGYTKIGEGGAEEKSVGAADASATIGGEGEAAAGAPSSAPEEGSDTGASAFLDATDDPTVQTPGAQDDAPDPEIKADEEPAAADGEEDDAGGKVGDDVVSSRTADEDSITTPGAAGDDADAGATDKDADGAADTPAVAAEDAA